MNNQPPFENLKKLIETSADALTMLSANDLKDWYADMADRPFQVFTSKRFFLKHKYLLWRLDNLTPAVYTRFREAILSARPRTAPQDTAMESSTTPVVETEPAEVTVETPSVPAGKVDIHVEQQRPRKADWFDKLLDHTAAIVMAFRFDIL